MTQNNRANALASLGELSGDASVLRRAIEGYDAALLVRSRAAVPAQWATTQQNRANTLHSLGKLSGDAAVLRLALDGLDAALSIRTREAMVAALGLTQGNRGNAPSSLANLGNDAAADLAIDAYRDALTVIARAVPKTNTNAPPAPSRTGWSAEPAPSPQRQPERTILKQSMLSLSP